MLGGLGKLVPRPDIFILAVLSAVAVASLSTLLAPFPAFDLVRQLLLPIVIAVAAIQALIAVFLSSRATNPRWNQVLALYRSLERRRSQDVGTLSDDQLRVLRSLPDADPGERASASEELTRRHASFEPAPEPIIPSFLSPDDLDRLEFRLIGPGRFITPMLLGAAAIGVASLFVLPTHPPVGGEYALVDRALRLGVPISVEQIRDGSAEIPAAAIARGASLPIAHDVVTFTLLGCVAVWLASTWLKSAPVRILFLRKFNEENLGKTYVRLIKVNLTRLGHVISLSDNFLKRSTWRWLIAPFSQATNPLALILIALWLIVRLGLRVWDKSRWGPPKVSSRREYRQLAKRIYDRLGLNLEVRYSSYAFLIRSTDSWWRHVVSLTLRSADVVILDLSSVTEGTKWEIHAIRDMQLLNRTVCLYRTGYAESAQQTIAEHPELALRPAFRHDDRGGIQNRREFYSELIQACRSSMAERRLTTEHRSPPSRLFLLRRHAFVIAATAVLTIILASVAQVSATAQAAYETCLKVEAVTAAASCASAARSPYLSPSWRSAAVAALTATSDRAPTHDDLARRALLSRHVTRLADDASNSGRDYASARDLYARAIRFDPLNVEAVRSRGMASARLRLWAAALEDFDRVDQLRPDIDVFADRAEARAHLGDLAGALKDVQRIRSDRINFEDKARGCWLLVQMDALGQASNVCDAVAASLADDREIDSDYRDELLRSIARSRALLDLQSSRPDRALAGFDDGLAKAPADASARLGRALAQIGLGRPADAAHDVDEALRLDPLVGSEYAFNSGESGRLARIAGQLASPALRDRWPRAPGP